MASPPFIYNNPLPGLLKKGLKIPDGLNILVPYPKPVTTYQEQIQKLKDRGLRIADEAKLLHLLKKINYYRLTGYCYPFLAGEKRLHQFKPDASFEKVFLIYRFDRELRLLVVRELEKIEIAVRAQIAQVFSIHHTSPFWYADSTNFKDQLMFDGYIDGMKEAFQKSDAEFIKAFKRNYLDPLPPCWMMFELMPFGALSMLYQNLKDTPQKRQVAEYFGLDKSSFTSWLHGLAYLRNICAHHSRLWNRLMGIQPAKPRSPLKTWLDNRTIPNNRCYYVFSIMLYLLQTIDSKNQFLFKLKLLFKRFPNVYRGALGFPDNWQQEPLWKERFSFRQIAKLVLTKKEKIKT